MQKPYPKIMVGGIGEYLLDVVAKHADRYNAYSPSLDLMRDRISSLEAKCNHHNRSFKDVQLSIVLPCLIRKTVDEVEEEKRHWSNEFKQFMQRFSERSAIGTPTNIIQKLTKYVEIGVTHFILHFISLNEDSLVLFDSEVISKI